MEVRKPNCLLLPFCCEGYELDVAAAHVEKVTEFLTFCGMEVEVSPLIDTADKAQQAAMTYNAACYDMAVLFPVTWSEPRLACMAARAFFGKPLLVWCVGQFSHKGEMLEMSSLPASAALRGTLQEMGVLCEWISYLPEAPYDEKKTQKVVSLSRAARALRMLENTRMVFFGHNFNGITSAGFDLSVLRSKFGTEVYSIDGSDLIDRMKKMEGEELEDAAKTVEQKVCGCMEAKKEDIIRMVAALRSYRKELGAQAVNMRCHSEFTATFGLTACLPLSVLGDEVITSCEADLPVTLTQLILHYLAGSNSAYVDLRLLEEGSIKVGACGMAPCNMCMGGKAKVGGGDNYLTNTSFLKPGRLTMARLLKFPGGQMALHTATGKALGEMEPLREMGCAVYPMTEIVPDQKIDDFTEYLGGNHYALVYEDVMDALELFCKYADLELL